MSSTSRKAYSQPWTTSEEIALCKAWCDVSESGTTTLNFKGFWSAILACFENEMGENIRHHRPQMETIDQLELQGQHLQRKKDSKILHQQIKSLLKGLNTYGRMYAIMKVASMKPQKLMMIVKIFLRSGIPRNKNSKEAEPSQPLSPPHKTPPSPHKPPPTSPPPPKLSPYNQKALSILHQDSPVFPITKGPTGHANTISPAEATLNWQSENVVAQNKVLVKILSQQGMITNSQEYLSSRVRSLESIINELRFKIQELHREIIQIIQTSPTTQPSSSISQKEAEMKNLKNQLQDLERQHKQKRITSLIDDPWRLPSTPFVVQFDVEEYEEHQENPNQETPTEYWYHSLGEYCQLQIQQSISPEAFMSIIYSEFIGSPWEHTAHAREEFLKMKCCSFQKKDLEKHYDRMSHRFYCLNGVDDVNLKQVFLNSFPESLGNEAYRALEARNVTIAQTTLGELYQLILNALAKLCNQKKFLAEFERTGKRLGTACDDKYLQIKCKDKSSCDCTHTKKKFHSKRFSSLSGKPRFSRRSSKKWKFIRKKKQRGRTSDSGKSHAELLLKFYSLVAKYGIMLSEKKMEVGVTTIQFLGMEISDGKYQPQPHVAQELLKFSDELSSQKMIQQFLGLVNYMADFLPKLSHHTALLFPMLKKNPPQWTSRQTEAVKAIKCLAEKMPPLKIPASSEKRILQTDASDECWGAVLLVQDNNNKRHVCGYKSGTFKASEQHYHSTFKEILAVKRGIEKFQFHLIGHEFQVEMDMSSFPRMLQFKRKMLPHAQLLRWSNSFSHIV
ncbi:putative zinc finger, CCHC-type containing protein [Tanacetum coccineum]